jgi:hypothetical protein
LIYKEDVVKKWFKASGARTGVKREDHSDPVETIPAPRTTETEKEKTQRQERAGAPTKICPVCGGAVVTKVLNYWCEPSTDVITPADTTETCVDCGKVVTTTLLSRGY